jgi:PST family polysaccharide transporter
MNVSWVRWMPEPIRRRIEGRHLLQRAIGNTGWLLTDWAVRLAGGLLVSVWVARYLGPDDYGKLSYAMALAALFGAAAAVSHSDVLVREFVNDRARQAATLASGVTIRVAGGFVAWAMAIGAVFLLRPGHRELHVLVAILAAGLVFQATGAIEAWFQSQAASRAAVIARIIAFVTTSLITVVLILMSVPLVGFGWVALVGSALMALCLLSAYRLTARPSGSWFPRWERMQYLFRESWQLWLAGLLLLAMMKMDQIMLGAMLGDRAAGIYGAAVRLSEVWYVLPMAIVGSAAPAIIEAKGLSMDLFADRLRRLFRLLAGLALAVAVLLSLGSRYVVEWLYGSAFSDAATVLAVHAWAMPFVFLGVGQAPWTVSQGLARLTLVRAMAALSINLLLNLVLIPFAGPVGAAAAVVISQAVWAVGFNVMDPRTRPVFAMQMRALIPHFTLPRAGRAP